MCKSMGGNNLRGRFISFIIAAAKLLPHNNLQIVTIHPLTFPFRAVSIIP